MLASKSVSTIQSFEEVKNLHISHAAEKGRNSDQADQKVAEPKRALIVVDVQNDFITGSLAVKDAHSIIKPINELIRTAHFDVIVFSRDAHPSDHISFASRHGREPFTSIEVEVPVPNEIKETSDFETCKATIQQELWPDHCIKGEEGWKFHPELDTTCADIFVSKGESADRDCYSAFHNISDSHINTNLGQKLRSRGIHQVYCVGLAFDFCVGSTAIDAAEHGFETFVIDDLVRGVMPETCASMKTRMDTAGVTILDHFEG